MTGKIPQTDPRASYLALRGAIDRAVGRVLEGGRYILGEEVAGFEREFASYIGQRHGIGVASGTDALVLGLKALDLPPDSYVATVSHTAVATVAAIELAGLKPLLLDIERATMTLDPEALARALEKPPGRISAVIPVHLYGQAADLGAILPVAARHGLKLIEDCAQCHGASLGGKRLGAFGDLSCFSFYPTKNLGAFGDGGAVLAGDPGLAARLAALREYGWRERYVSERPGMNSRLDELQAAVLRVKLAGLDAGNARRAAIADRYDRGLQDTGLLLPARRGGATHVFHQYVVRTAKRDALRKNLEQQGIGTGIHYPLPVHLQDAYRGRIALDPAGLGESERAAHEVLSLPMFPELDEEAVARVIAAIRKSL
ncbi:MAG TPA: DegT/DnrJ/EryC1/StrS family aminotransferase [Stellaceae bacterium]|nr:DegT/DnrJ/EryC1/StrS family aminotransferase [Stellaceae bacterium]